MAFMSFQASCGHTRTLCTRTYLIMRSYKSTSYISVEHDECNMKAHVHHIMHAAITYVPSLPRMLLATDDAVSLFCSTTAHILNMHACSAAPRGAPSHAPHI